MATYPRSVIPVLTRKWQALSKRQYGKPSILPARAELNTLIDIAFHATFLAEEGRRPGFRIIHYLPKDYKEDSEQESKGIFYFGEYRLIPLDKARPFNVSEVNRLAPAAELTRLILCVANLSDDLDEPSFCIWAMLDVGENWWKFIHHETSGGKPPPNHLTITSSNPGELSFSVQGEMLLTLKSGQIFHPTRNALWIDPISDFFKDGRRQLYKDTVKSLNSSVWDPKGHDDDYPFRFYNFFLERILFNIRSKQHGGIVIFIPSYITKYDTRLTDRINIKYPCSYDYAWKFMVRSLANQREFYDLHFPLWDGKQKTTKKLFQEHYLLAEEEQELDESLSDIAQAIASLTSVDGALIMNDRFVVMGFGVEVTAPSPSLKDVVVVTRPTNRRVDIQSYGTRHRAAFRFCSSFEQSVAFVVSSDGGVKAVKRDGSDVFLWPDINTGSMGL